MGQHLTNPVAMRSAEPKRAREVKVSFNAVVRLKPEVVEREKGNPGFIGHEEDCDLVLEVSLVAINNAGVILSGGPRVYAKPVAALACIDLATFVAEAEASWGGNADPEH